MSKEKNWSPDTKKALEDVGKSSKKLQREIDKKARESKKTWLDLLSEGLGASGDIMSGNSSSGGGY